MSLHGDMDSKTIFIMILILEEQKDNFQEQDIGVSKLRLSIALIHCEKASC
jgi:hypothetical protein